MSSNPARRCWINQPSKLQLLHEFHGTKVLAFNYMHGHSVVYFLDGDVVSMTVPNKVLSEGWDK